MHGQLNDARVMDRKETIAVVGLGMLDHLFAVLPVTNGM
jgi:hypothetical protein